MPNAQTGSVRHAKEEMKMKTSETPKKATRKMATAQKARPRWACALRPSEYHLRKRAGWRMGKLILSNLPGVRLVDERLRLPEAVPVVSQEVAPFACERER